MSFATSTSLAASDFSRKHELPRLKATGHIKNGLLRHSKQALVEHQMFGSRMGTHGKSLPIGKKFRQKGKGLMKAISMKSHSISPSPEEFDKMMSESVTHNPNKKRSMFSRKQFG